MAKIPNRAAPRKKGRKQTTMSKKASEKLAKPASSGFLGSKVSSGNTNNSAARAVLTAGATRKPINVLMTPKQQKSPKVQKALARANTAFGSQSTRTRNFSGGGVGVVSVNIPKKTKKMKKGK